MSVLNDRPFSLSSLFSTTIIKHLANQSYYKLSEILRKNLRWLKYENTLKDAFEKAYKVLCSQYRSEYVYKNTIANKILLERHSLDASNMYIDFPVGTAKADCVIVNGTLTAYEIKTDFDNFVRLKNQLTQYKKVFEYIYVVVSDNNLDKIKKVLSHDIGIMILNNDLNLIEYRKASSQRNSFDPEMIFQVLHMNEYKSIIKKYFNVLPDLPNTLLYQEYKKFFCELKIDCVYNDIVKMLRKRNINEARKFFIDKMPYSLKALSFKCNFSKKKYNILPGLLEEPLFSFIEG